MERVYWRNVYYTNYTFEYQAIGYHDIVLVQNIQRKCGN